MQQRVFDTIPEHPAEMSMNELCAILPFARRTVYEVARELERKVPPCVERVDKAELTYRRTKGATRPDDARGKGATGRPPHGDK